MGKCVYYSLSPVRVGLMGNPSDGFEGKTISLSIANFWADVTIMESPRLVSAVRGLVDNHSCSAKQTFLVACNNCFQILFPVMPSNRN